VGKEERNTTSEKKEAMMSNLWQNSLVSKVIKYFHFME
jgi:hypothetical protein